MTSTSPNNDEPLIAVHVCKSCGAATERSDVNAESVITGLVQCRVCGAERELNIEIRNQSGLVKRPPARAVLPKE
jgi:transcription elongation factor Elf1